jgi:hypothetical protein
MQNNVIYVNPCFITLIRSKVNSSSDNPWERWNFWSIPKFLIRLKCESRVNIAEEWRIGVCSLVHNTSGVEGRAKSPIWGLGRVTSKSITHTDLHIPNQLVHSCSTFNAWTNHGQTWTNHGQTWTHKTHHGPNLKEATTFPFIVLFVLSHGTNTQMSFCPGTSKLESPEIP